MQLGLNVRSKHLIIYTVETIDTGYQISIATFNKVGNFLDPTFNLCLNFGALSF